MLILHTFKTSEYVVFDKQEGNKIRTIYKLPYYPDRIVQWAILQVIEPYLIKTFISQTYSAIPGRGAHKALHTIRNDIARDPDGCQWCYKFDIHHYYQSINHDLLMNDWNRLFKDKDLLIAINEITRSVSTSEISGVGIPIGNYLSQYSGNLFLSKLDHFCKEILRLEHYYRYMDDIVILEQSKEKLWKIKHYIDKLLKEMKLTIKSNWQIFSTYKRGIDFVGYRIYKDYVLVRKTTATKAKKKLNKINEKSQFSEHDNGVIASYYGIVTHCDTYNFLNKYFCPLLENDRLKGKIRNNLLQTKIA